MSGSDHAFHAYDLKRPRIEDNYDLIIGRRSQGDGHKLQARVILTPKDLRRS